MTQLETTQESTLKQFETPYDIPKTPTQKKGGIRTEERENEHTDWHDQFFVLDKTETRLSHFFMYEMRLSLPLTQNFRRDRESRCLFLRDQDENHLLMKKMIEFENYKSRSGRDRDET